MRQRGSKCCVLAAVLAELVFFLYKTGESMLDAATRPYIVRVVCLDTYPNNQSICSVLSNYPELEDKVQTIAGTYLMYYRIFVNLPAVFLGLFCGAWSDKYGRKLPMMLPSLGSVFAVLLYMLSLICEEWTMPVILMGSAVQGIFGKSSVITMAVNSYCSDITDKEDRTKKLGQLLAMNFFGLFTGSLLAGVLQEQVDLEMTFCTVVFIHAATILIVVICMRETIELPMVEAEKKELSDKPGEKRCNTCRDFFQLSNIRDSFHVLTRNRYGNTRLLIASLFLISVMNQTCKVGEMDVTVLFVTRTPLSWPKAWYGYLLAVDYAVMGLCLLLVLPVFSNLLKVPDTIIIVMGIGCKVARLVWAGFCTETWMVYTSVVIGSLAGMIMSALRSLMSKTVDEDELGKTFSLLASGETLSKLLGSVIFVNIYNATAYFFPGFAYMVEAFLYVIALVFMVWIYKEVKATGTYNLLDGLSPNVYGDPQDKQAWRHKAKEVIDELEEQPIFPQPLPVTTP